MPEFYLTVEYKIFSNGILLLALLSNDWALVGLQFWKKIDDSVEFVFSSG